MEEEKDIGTGYEIRRQKSSGSVKRARQRAAAGLSSEDYRDPLEPEPLNIPSNRTTPNRTPPSRTPPQRSNNGSPQYPEYTPHGNRKPPEPPSRTPQRPSPTSSSPVTPPAPRWPPSPQSPANLQKTQSPAAEAMSPRGPPPQRPPRPAMVPPLSEQQPENYWENDFMPIPTQGSRKFDVPRGSPTDTTPSTIPEYQTPFTPQYALPPRRNLGPPPSARKGGANFYPQNTFVTPIPEEQSETHSSFASSHVIPASWGDGPPEYYMESGIDEEEDDDIQSPNSTNDGRESRSGDHDESTELVRKVSIGKPGKPALKSVKSQESDREDPGEQPKSGQEVQFGPGAGVATFLAPSSNSNSPDTTPKVQGTADTSQPTSYPESSSPQSPVDPTVAKILGGLEKGGALNTGGTVTPLTSTAHSTSEKGSKRPARLNLDAVRESEPRGSATSLPELIRRATKLASNLDRGRTASRIGILDLLEREKSKHPSRNGSISDMLAAFPSPSLATPTGERHGSRLPSPLAHSGLSKGYTASTGQSYYREPARRRKCCGMPVWAFFLLCIILLLLVAAAVVIPITLVVLPRQNDDSGAPTGGCKKSFPCSNGGTSFVQDRSCRCICANGFTGASCDAAPGSGCITIDINDSGSVYRNATIGTGVNRIFAGADASFGIPLQPAKLLSLFSSQNLTCPSESALITFNGRFQRRTLTLMSRPIRELRLVELLSEPRPSPILLNPRTAASKAVGDQAAVTSNGLVFAAPTRAGGASSPKATGSPSSSSPDSPPSSSSSSPSAAGTVTSTILEFARTVVLFIFQEHDLLAAASAQQRMQDILGNEQNFNTSAVDVGRGVRIDWEHMTVDLGNGTLFGGKGTA
ncbi:MAG: hypothetical protein LQ351_007614 [Letrouitia transgressa]|nr:MAG: hypothetical protein LQ351_007614 [Letrouitia transgressa]